MDIREYDATADDAWCERVVSLYDAVNAADSPWLHGATVTTVRRDLTSAWEGDVPRWFAVVENDDLVAVGNLFVSTWDNADFADVSIDVHPDHRRRGHGTALLDHLLGQARQQGQSKAGIGGWNSPESEAFATRHGFRLGIRNVQRRQTLADTDWALLEKLYADAAERAGDYELLRLFGATPPDLLPRLAEMTAAINDAPLDDLDVDDEVFPPERIVAYETAQLAFGRLYRVVARHRETGELAGHTVVCVETERPWIGGQHDTSVVRAHRGHRLGVLLKTDMLRWLREAEPRLAEIDTWNAKSNDHMIGVNEQLGYRVTGESAYYQRAL